MGSCVWCLRWLGCDSIRSPISHPFNMCLERDLQDLNKQKKPAVNAHIDRRLRNISKPRLPRKVTNTCINLNKFWSELEEIYSAQPPPPLLRLEECPQPAPNTITHRNIMRNRNSVPQPLP